MKVSCFRYCWKALSVVSLFKNVWDKSREKNYHLVSLLYIVNKILEKLTNIGFFITLSKMSIYPISSMSLGLLDQLQIFR